MIRREKKILELVVGDVKSSSGRRPVVTSVHACPRWDEGNVD